MGSKIDLTGQRFGRLVVQREAESKHNEATWLCRCDCGNVTVEGCYIPFDWRNSFDERYLQSIKFICLAMSDEYIDSHFEEIKSHGSDIETRLDDSYCTVEQMKLDNHQIIDGYQSNGEKITLITENFDDSIRGVLDQHIPFCRAETLL